MLRRVFIGLAAFLLVAAVAVAVVYFFGVPRSGEPGRQVAAVEAPAPDPATPLAIEIPGCVCHSDDPKVVEEHRAYRMSQCAGCHGGQTPTGR